MWAKRGKDLAAIWLIGDGCSIIRGVPHASLAGEYGERETKLRKELILPLLDEYAVRAKRSLTLSLTKQFLRNCFAISSKPPS
jgi:hypothetical protein